MNGWMFSKFSCLGRDLPSYSLVVNAGPVGGGLEPPAAVGAAQVGQRAPLLEPAAQTRLDLTVDVPGRKNKKNEVRSQRRRSAGVTALTPPCGRT